MRKNKTEVIVIILICRKNGNHDKKSAVQTAKVLFRTVFYAFQIKIDSVVLDKYYIIKTCKIP